MRADRDDKAYFAAAAAFGMDNAVPAGAYQYAPAGRFLATRGERLSLRTRQWVPRGSGAAVGCGGNLHRAKSGGGGACGVSTGGIFSDPRPGMPARQLRQTRGRGRGVADKAATTGGDSDPAVAQTEACDGHH